MQKIVWNNWSCYKIDEGVAEMRRQELCKKVTDLGRAGQRTLSYFITIDGGRGEGDKAYLDYGVGVMIEESGEEALCRCLTVNDDEIKKLADLIATNYVTPVSLGDVIEDWLGR
jgi:hypothetical protein